MANFKVNTDALSGQATQLSGLSGEMDLICQRLLRINVANSIQAGLTSAMTWRLSDCSTAVSNQSGNLRALSAGLTEIAQIYRNTEVNLTDPQTQAEATVDTVLEVINDIFDFNRWYALLGPFNPFLVNIIGVLGILDGQSTGDRARGGGGGGGRSMDDDDSISGSLLSGVVSGAGSWLGVNTAGELRGDVLGYELDGIAEANWNLTDGEAGVRVGGTASGYLARGSAEGHFGFLGGEGEISVGNAAVSGDIGFTLFDNGVFTPAIGGGVEAEVSVLHGEGEVYLGDEDNNVHVGAEGTVLGAEASAEARVGVITREDPVTGQVTTSYGAAAEVEAEAYLAQGTVSGGVSFFGIDVDVSATGKAGGAGVSAGGSVTTDGVSGNFGLGLLLGGEVEVSIDWSDADLPTWEDLGNAWDDFTSSVGDFFGW